MELNELNAEERMALVALVERVIASDGEASDDELAVTQGLIARIGEDAYNEAVAAVDERLGDEAALKEFLKSLSRQDAREIIYEAVLEAAIPDAIGEAEAALLDWLAETWDIEVHFEGPDDGEV